MEVQPYVFFNGRCEEALDYYRQHLGAELPDADLSGVAALSLGHTGADVVGWIKGAKSVARSQARPMTLTDLVDAVCPASPMSQADTFRVAVHEAGHAVVAAVGIGLRKHVQIFLVDDRLNHGRAKRHPPKRNGGVSPIGFAQLLDKVDQNIATAPLSRMDAA